VNVNRILNAKGEPIVLNAREQFVANRLQGQMVEQLQA
jgi:hypothetical protein